MRKMKPGIFPDPLEVLHYLVSNGSNPECYQERWCYRCLIRDACQEQKKIATRKGLPWAMQFSKQELAKKKIREML